MDWGRLQAEAPISYGLGNRVEDEVAEDKAKQVPRTKDAEQKPLSSKLDAATILRQ